MSEQLTQSEIDEMIQKAIAGDLSDLNEQSEDAGEEVVLTQLSDLERDAIGEISNISMGAAATALYAILGRKVVITTPDVSVVEVKRVSDDHKRPFVMVDVEYSSGFVGHNLFILKVDDVKIMTDIMMGGEGVVTDEELSELHLSAISEAMNQMMGGMSTAMADMFNKPINISPPQTRIVTLTEEHVTGLIQEHQNELIRVQFKMEIEDLINSGIMQLMPVHFGRQLVEQVLGTIQTTPAVQQPQTPTAPAATSPAATAAPIPAAAPIQTSVSAQPAAPALEPTRKIDVRPIELASFDSQDNAGSTGLDDGMDLIMDVPLQITVELGQCKKTIKEILDLNLGSIVALDHLAGEPVDVVVNGKSVAKGEVIVIDDNYGVRITEVMTGSRKVRSLS